MKANTRRGDRLSFDMVAELYDQARPGIPSHLVTAMLRMANVGPGDHILEVGAGTGQLTLPLRAAGPHVVALEPGEHLRALLARRTAGNAWVTVRGDLFEDYDARDDNTPFAAVFSANAWQWIDPAISYAKAADLLRPGGHLALAWNFPIAKNAELQRALNDQAFAGHPDAVRDPDTHLPGIEERAAEGRAELAASGRYEAPWWQLSTDSFTLTAAEYAALLTSYANAATLTSDGRDDLEKKVLDVLDIHRVRKVEMINHLYACVARRSDR